MSTQTYSVSGDFPNNLVHQAVLTREIKESSITPQLIGLNVIGDVCTIVFTADVTPDILILDAVVAAHQGNYDNNPDVIINSLETDQINGIGATGVLIESVPINNGLVDGVDVSAHNTATTGVHGISGAIVGTTDSQTLTNKTIDATNNTISGLTNSDVGLGNVPNLLFNLTATAAPTVGDDSADGYSVGSRWIDITNDEEYICLNNSLGAAIWMKTNFGGIVETAVSPGLSSTTSTVFQSKLVLTTSSLPLGIYRISWYFELRNTTQYNEIQFRVRLGATTISTGYGADLTGALGFTTESGYFFTAAISGVQTIDIFYRAGASTAQIQNARLEIIRI